KATRIQDKVAGVGFDWDNIDDVFAKIKEEIDELHAEVKAQKQTNIESEFGDVLFSLINYARFLKVNPEDALERTNRKFITRFQYLEQRANEKGKSLKDMTLQEMETYWQEAKKIVKQ
ncbi:MAG: MazG nucleotide pyrophosphohydrolase domain-containing protein, partial [Capnocytophaga ochracea]